jgi:6-phosphogluconolactonase
MSWQSTSQANQRNPRGTIMLTRRRFLVLFPAFAVPAIAAPAQTLPFKKKRPIAPPPPVFVYFGTDTKKGVSKGIYQSRFDPKTGQLTTPILAAATARPSFLALSPPRNGPRFVYAVNAVNDPAATVTTFVLDPNTGALRQVGQVPSGSAGPCYISVDSTGRSAFVANCMGSSISSYRILPDGTLSQPVDQIDFKDHKRFGALGPNNARQGTPPPPPAPNTPPPTPPPPHHTPPPLHRRNNHASQLHP